MIVEKIWSRRLLWPVSCRYHHIPFSDMLLFDSYSANVLPQKADTVKSIRHQQLCDQIVAHVHPWSRGYQKWIELTKQLLGDPFDSLTWITTLDGSDHVSWHCLTSDNVFACPGCPANLPLCWNFRICAWIMLWLWTSMWLWLFRMPSLTVNGCIASFSFRHTRCLVAAISSHILLLLAVRVQIQEMISSSVNISIRSLLLVSGAVILKTSWASVSDMPKTLTSNQCSASLSWATRGKK